MANLRAYLGYMFAHPARSSCSWAANLPSPPSGTTTPPCPGACWTIRPSRVQTLVRDFNALYRREAALQWRATASRPASAGSSAMDRENSVFAFLREGGGAPFLVILQHDAGALGMSIASAPPWRHMGRGAQFRCPRLWRIGCRKRRGIHGGGISGEPRDGTSARLTLPPLATSSSVRETPHDPAAPPRRLEAGHPYLLAPRRMGLVPTLPSSPPMRSASSCACSIRAPARGGPLPLPECTDEVWHGYLPRSIRGPHLWLPRLWSLGPGERPPLQPHKLLLDPYARQITARRAGRTPCSPIAWAADAPT